MGVIKLAKPTSAQPQTVRLSFGTKLPTVVSVNQPPAKETVVSSNPEIINPQSSHVNLNAIKPVSNNVSSGTVVKDRKPTRSGLCTFIQNERKEKEDWFHCYTCGFEENRGICSICVRACHSSHDVAYADYSKFLCDCGAAGKCLALVEKSPEKKVKKKIANKGILYVHYLPFIL